MLHPPLRQHIEKITPLSDDEFEYVLAHFKPKKVHRHQFLVEESEPVPHEYFVVSSAVWKTGSS